MSRNKMYLAILISSLLVVIFYVAYAMMNIGKEKQHYTISVIVNDSSSDRWNAFKEGMNQGADDNGIYLNVVSTPEFANLEEECFILRRELENDVDGVIVEMYESKDADGAFADALSEMPAVMVDNMSAPFCLYSVVSPDNEKMGQALAQAIIQEEKEHLEGLKIGILCGNLKKSSLQQRLEGFEKALDGTDVRVLWKIARNGNGNSQLLEKNMEDYPVDVLVAMENDETEQAVDFLLESPEISSRLYGEGRSEKNVYYLDKGVIQALIVPNEYYMGYKSVDILVQELENAAVPGEETEVDFLSVTKDRMYDDDVVKILFPTIR